MRGSARLEITRLTVEGRPIDVNEYRIVDITPRRNECLQSRDISLSVVENSLVDKGDDFSVSLSRRDFRQMREHFVTWLKT